MNRQAPILINKNNCKEGYIQVKQEHFVVLNDLLKDKPKQLIMMMLLMSAPNGTKITEKWICESLHIKKSSYHRMRNDLQDIGMIVVDDGKIIINYDKLEQESNKTNAINDDIDILLTAYNNSSSMLNDCSWSLIGQYLFSTLELYFDGKISSENVLIHSLLDNFKNNNTDDINISDIDIDKLIVKSTDNKNIKDKSQKNISTKVRAEVLYRDNYKCKHCGRGPEDGVKLHVDHIVPYSKGGGNDISNLQTLCAECNMGKGNREWN